MKKVNRPVKCCILPWSSLAPTALLSLLQQIAVPLSNVQEKRNALSLELVLQLHFTDEYVNLPPQQKQVPT